MNKFEREIKKLLKTKGIENPIIESPPDPKLGDYAVPCYPLAKRLKKAPNKIASEVSKELTSKYFNKIVSTGPYINFYADTSKMAEDTLTQINKEYGKTSKGANQKVMIEFSSPNTNKPLHLGHVRNILIGESISRIYEETGHKVIRGCLVNDRGVHICKSMLAYKEWGKNKEPDKKPDHYVGDWYVKYAEEAKKNEELESQTQEMLKKWEENDKETIKLWKKMNKWVYDGFNETYKKIGVRFDKTYYESEHYKKSKSIVKQGQRKGVFKKDEKGNIIAELSKHGFTDDKVVLRSDDTSVYITQDIALAKQKIDDFKLDKSFYVVGSEQRLHFQQLFKIIDLLKLMKTENLHHISYGMVNLPEGKMKSREGTVVDADDIMKEVIDLARMEVDKRYKDLSDKEKETRAIKIGLGALKFFILKMDASKDMTYNPKEAISFEGETGPYVQYVNARINSIFEKGKSDTHNKPDYDLYDDKEKQIIKKLSSYPLIIQDSAKHYKPSIIARYLLELSQMFSDYYNTHQILKRKRKC